MEEDYDLEAYKRDVNSYPVLSHEHAVDIDYTNAAHIHAVNFYCFGQMTNVPLQNILTRLINGLEPKRRVDYPYQKGAVAQKDKAPEWWRNNPWSTPWGDSPHRIASTSLFCLLTLY